MAKPKHMQSDSDRDDNVSSGQQLTEIYRFLFDHYGPQHWWPADSPFEVIVGAILTQSTSWANVEKAIMSLKRADALSPASLRELPLDRLAALIRPSGYYNAKAAKLKSFVEYLGEAHQDSLEKLFSLDVEHLHSELLAIHGIGPETADAIILYAARKPVFVIDAYTIRILSRLGIGTPNNDYSAFQTLFAENLPAEERLFNEFHALLVRHGKEVCKRNPLCDQCCLRGTIVECRLHSYEI
ncbi:MAG: endonuclease III domain-containing protein [Dehalococcoidia bacterium]